MASGYTDGVMLFLRKPGAFETAGNSGIRIRPPTSGVYAGVSFFQARDNTTDASINGIGVFDIAGTLYQPKGKMVMAGNVGRTVGRIIVWQLDLSGEGVFRLTGTGVPSSGNQHVSLVE